MVKYGHIGSKMREKLLLVASAGFAGLIAFGGANAASPYMGTSGYQSPQSYYRPSAGSGAEAASGAQAGSYYNGGGYYNNSNSGYAGARNQEGSFNRMPTAGQARQNAAARKKNAADSAPGEDGFFLGAGLSRQYAQWQYELQTLGSILNYSDLAWNVFDVKAGYKTGDVVIGLGLQYGMQAGKSFMTDDDITNGGGGYKFEGEDHDHKPTGFVVRNSILSIGESKGGSMLGMHLGLGLANAFGSDSVKITPSIGYRMMKYKLTTSNNSGLSVEYNDALCEPDDLGSLMCPAMISFWDGSDWVYLQNMINIGTLNDPVWIYPIPPGASGADYGDNYAFTQAGFSHVYEVSWNGPFIAADIDVGLGGDYSMSGRIEIGFPGYEAVGDQPYRIDWAHPKSLGDKKGMFGALHLGMGANWMAKISDQMRMSIGLTYDYYEVKKADAVSYLSKYYYDGVRKWAEDPKEDGTGPGKDADRRQDVIDQLDDLYKSCNNSWTCVDPGEVNSFYRAVGIRIGIEGEF